MPCCANYVLNSSLLTALLTRTLTYIFLSVSIAQIISSIIVFYHSSMIDQIKHEWVGAVPFKFPEKIRSKNSIPRWMFTAGKPHTTRHDWWTIFQRTETEQQVETHINRNEAGREDGNNLHIAAMHFVYLGFVYSHQARRPCNDNNCLVLDVEPQPPSVVFIMSSLYTEPRYPTTIHDDHTPSFA